LPLSIKKILYAPTESAQKKAMETIIIRDFLFLIRFLSFKDTQQQQQKTEEMK